MAIIISALLLGAFQVPLSLNSAEPCSIITTLPNIYLYGTDEGSLAIWDHVLSLWGYGGVIKSVSSFPLADIPTVLIDAKSMNIGVQLSAEEIDNFTFYASLTSVIGGYNSDFCADIWGIEFGNPQYFKPATYLVATVNTSDPLADGLPPLFHMKTSGLYLANVTNYIGSVVISINYDGKEYPLVIRKEDDIYFAQRVDFTRSMILDHPSEYLIILQNLLRQKGYPIIMPYYLYVAIEIHDALMLKNNNTAVAFDCVPLYQAMKDIIGWFDCMDVAVVAGGVNYTGVDVAAEIIPVNYTKDLFPDKWATLSYAKQGYFKIGVHGLTHTWEWDVDNWLLLYQSEGAGSPWFNGEWKNPWNETDIPIEVAISRIRLWEHLVNITDLRDAFSPFLIPPNYKFSRNIILALEQLGYLVLCADHTSKGAFTGLNWTGTNVLAITTVEADIDTYPDMIAVLRRFLGFIINTYHKTNYIAEAYVLRDSSVPFKPAHLVDLAVIFHKLAVNNITDIAMGSDYVEFTYNIAKELDEQLVIYFPQEISYAIIDGNYYPAFNGAELYLPKLSAGPHTIKVVYGSPSIPCIRRFSHVLKNEKIEIISANYANQRLATVLFAPSGTLFEIAVYSPLGMPSSITIGGTTYTSPVPTRADFDAADYDCWYYDSANNLIYIKARGHSPVEITISWAAGGGIPPPPPEEERPAPQPQLPAMRPELLLLVILAAAALVIALLISRKR